MTNAEENGYGRTRSLKLNFKKTKEEKDNKN